MRFNVWFAAAFAVFVFYMVFFILSGSYILYDPGAEEEDPSCPLPITLSASFDGLVKLDPDLRARIIAQGGLDEYIRNTRDRSLRDDIYEGCVLQLLLKAGNAKDSLSTDCKKHCTSKKDIKCDSSFELLAGSEGIGPDLSISSFTGDCSYKVTLTGTCSCTPYEEPDVAENSNDYDTLLEG